MGVWDITGASADGSGNLTLTGGLTATTGTLSGALAAASLVLTGALTSSGLVTLPVQAVTMGGNNKTLIMSGSPGANQVLVAANILTATATGATRTLTMPAAALTTGKPFLIINAGAESIDVTDAEGTTTLASGKSTVAISNGAGYGYMLGA